MLLTLVLAVCLARIQYVATKFNMSAIWNGYGAIPTVQNKTALAPMVYRPLMGWLLGGRVTVRNYEVVRLAMMWAMLYALFLAWGLEVMLISAVLFTVTIYFDYWDWMIEVMAYSLALVSFPLALVGAAILGMSRETAPLVGFVYALHSLDFLGGAILFLVGVIVLLLVREIQGKHPLYCKRWMWQENLAMLQGGKVITGRWSVYYSLGLCILAAIGACLRPDGLLVPVLVGAGWGMAKANETRVFAGVIPYAALALSGLI